LDNPWFVIDLKQNSVRPTAYTLRHYSSWDTECLRYWPLSRDPRLADLGFASRKHVNDEALNGEAARSALSPSTLPPTCGPSLVMTGLNNNSAKYMALSGFEVYGWLRPRKLQRPPSRKSEVVTTFMYRATDVKTNNHNLSTWGGSRTMAKPCTGGLGTRLGVVGHGGLHRPELLGKEVVRCVTKPLPSRGS